MGEYKNKLIKWAIPDGDTPSEIGRVLINHRYKNIVRQSQVQSGRNADMDQKQQRRVVIMDICLKLMKKYKQQKNTDGRITHNIRYRKTQNAP